MNLENGSGFGLEILWQCLLETFILVTTDIFTKYNT